MCVVVASTINDAANLNSVAGYGKKHKVVPRDQIVITSLGECFISCRRAAKRHESKTINLPYKLIVLIISGERRKCVEIIDYLVDVSPSRLV